MRAASFCTSTDLAGWPSLSNERARSARVSRSLGFSLKQIWSLESAAMASLASLALEVDLGGDAGEPGVGAVLEEALDHLERVVAPAQLEEDLRRRAEALDGAVDVLHPHERLGEAQVRERVLRVEVDDLAEDVDGVAIAAGALVARGHLVVRRERVAGQPGWEYVWASFGTMWPKRSSRWGTCLWMISRICL